MLTLLFRKNRTYGHNLQKIVHSTVKLLLKSGVDTKDMFLVIRFVIVGKIAIIDKYLNLNI